MARSTRITIGVTAVALLCGAGAGAYYLTGGGSSGGEARPVPTGPPSRSEVETTAHDFLAAWSAGRTEQAAALTDDSAAASAALTGYRDTAHVRKVTLTPGTAQGTRVPFSVSAEIAYRDHSSTWRYDSSLAVVRSPGDGRAVVGWQPTVIHPRLAHGETLRTDSAPPANFTAVDRNGKELDPKDYPSLAAILPELRQRFAAKASGERGVEVRAEPGGAGGPSAKTLYVVSKGTPATLRTTLDAKLQRAAEEAVGRRPDASVVAVRPSTGEILAVADTGARKAGFNSALLGRTAPGSTMKVVTSALLLERGQARPEQPLPCPKYATYGMRFHNVEEGENPGATFAQDFAASCNTAFISLAGRISDGDLSAEARDVFGIGLNWQTGATSFDGSVPADSGAGKAAAMIGQGQVQMNPLTMASVTATAITGSFHQPHLVDPQAMGLKTAQAARSLPASVVGQIKSMMRLTVTRGTATKAMAGLSGDTGAKTGSAEIDNQAMPNGWFAGYRDDLAAAAVVPQGGHGGDSAGPVVRAVLAAG
ncbi:penicillin-binding transpeptidase domain-containing protein [Streptomyces orinoci]|uniref:Penicillin-binding transpeptidase domain-containing protein n=1 Tax=Streptomyces orinoci TaxID=67339 RepID=A0ABV3K6W2_STRON|nr:penicillin-binding transpeptidase domain-containing protein [Streptomyces orinoci]